MFNNPFNKFCKKNINKYGYSIASTVDKILKKELSEIKIAALLVLMKKHKKPYIYKKVLEILDRYKKFEFENEKSIEIAYPYNLKKKSPYLLLVSSIILSVLERENVKCIFHGDDVYDENTKDVFDYLNISSLTKDEAVKLLKNMNITFINRKLFLPELSEINHIRKELNIKETFYYTERFTNPLNSNFLIAGAKNNTDMKILYSILKDRYKRFSIVVGDEEGFPDIYKPNQKIYVFDNGEKILDYKLDKFDINLKFPERFTIEKHVNFIESLFSDKGIEDYKNIISLNGALILYTCSYVNSLEEGKALVSQLIDKYSFLNVLKNIQFYTNYLNFKNIFEL